MARKQQDIPGTERPSIPELDEVICTWLDAKDEAKNKREEATEARTAATEAIREVADQLERDDHDNPVYCYRDDYREIAVKLSTSSKLITEVLLSEEAE